ncbi:thioesterase family protein [Streptococcus devriesei]|uniref:thioesterase family protein n=1 Tax=Streptococcus devriesei TaxID=231233 RepID=UPI00040CBFFE|nr:thioesterase family protein [Streptococcus devriesei]
MSIYSKSYTTAPKHSAMHLGSGCLNVLSTPSMTAFIENTAFLYCEEKLDVSETTVGAQITVQHLTPTKIGQAVDVRILEADKDGRRFHFKFEVYEGDKLIGKGEHTRVTVNIQKFLDKLD